MSTNILVDITFRQDCLQKSLPSPLFFDCEFSENPLDLSEDETENPLR